MTAKAKFTAGLALLATALPLLAHHSFVAEYDPNGSVTLKGAVTKLEWTNPHIYYYVDVKEDNGAVVNWAVEGYPPNTLRRTGVTREMFKPGDEIAVTGWKARDGSKRVASREVTFADGKKAFTGPPAQ